MWAHLCKDWLHNLCLLTARTKGQRPPPHPPHPSFASPTPGLKGANGATNPSPIMGAIGVTVNGVQIFNNADALRRDAYVNEGHTFDACGGHASPGGAYHFHTGGPGKGVGIYQHTTKVTTGRTAWVLLCALHPALVRGQTTIQLTTLLPPCRCPSLQTSSRRAVCTPTRRGSTRPCLA